MTTRPQALLYILLSVYMFAFFFLSIRSGWEIPLYIAFIPAVWMEFRSPLPAGSRRYFYRVLALMVIFVSLNLLSAYFAYDAPGMEFSHRQSSYFKGVVLAFVVGLGIRDRRSLNRFITALLASFGIWMSLELVNYVFLFVDPVDGGKRLVGFRNYNPNILAFQLVIFLSFYLTYAFDNRRKLITLFTGGGAALALFLLFLTGSRNGWVTVLVVTMPASLVFSGPKGNLKKRAIAALMVFLLTASVGYFYWFKYARPERRSFSSINSRVIHWQAAAEVIKEGPWYRVVIGQGSIKKVLKKMHAKWPLDGKVHNIIRHAHNTSLQVLLETGFLGWLNLAAVWLLLFMKTLSNWLKNTAGGDLEPALLVALLSIPVLSLVDHVLWHVVGMNCWLVVGLALARVRVNELERVENGSHLTSRVTFTG
ncbi:MAG: O-antigen ligase family protein [bacterium]|nr:O-antigen ligase family protein [bacterium]MDT8365296.1 O-antigen ligase family protein [bacterium]